MPATQHPGTCWSRVQARVAICPLTSSRSWRSCSSTPIHLRREKIVATIRPVPPPRLDIAVTQQMALIWLKCRVSARCNIIMNTLTFASLKRTLVRSQQSSALNLSFDASHTHLRLPLLKSQFDRAVTWRCHLGEPHRRRCRSSQDDEINEWSAHAHRRPAIEKNITRHQNDAILEGAHDGFTFFSPFP